MFVYVTKDLVIYDRTNGKNLRLSYDTDYQMGVGSLKFKHLDGRVFVERFSSTGKQVYVKDITESGMYLVSAVFVQPLPKSPKEVRNLYNRLKTSIGKPHFKIDTDDNLSAPFKIKLHTWLDKGFNYRFIIKVKETTVTTAMVTEIFNLIDRMTKIDLQVLLQYYKAFDKNGVVVKIDDEFIQMATRIEESVKAEVAAI